MGPFYLALEGLKYVFGVLQYVCRVLEGFSEGWIGVCKGLLTCGGSSWVFFAPSSLRFLYKNITPAESLWGVEENTPVRGEAFLMAGRVILAWDFLRVEFSLKLALLG